MINIEKQPLHYISYGMVNIQSALVDEFT